MTEQQEIALLKFLRDEITVKGIYEGTFEDIVTYIRNNFQAK